MPFLNLPGNLYTIGYAGFNLDQFLLKLKTYQIHCIIDVRSTPYSSNFRDFNKETLASILKDHKIWYLHFKDEFGARQTNSSFFKENDNYLDFEKFRQSDHFKKGYNRVISGLKQGYNLALMCAEIEPSHCHRSIMIARAFALNNIKVLHLLPNKVKTQKDIDQELLETYCQDSYVNQGFRGNLLSLNKSYQDLKDENLIKAYQARNQEIGFKKKDEDEF